MSHVSASFSATIRVRLAGRARARSGGSPRPSPTPAPSLGDINTVRRGEEDTVLRRHRRDRHRPESTSQAVVAASVRALPDAEVLQVTDRVFRTCTRAVESDARDESRVPPRRAHLGSAPDLHARASRASPPRPPPSAIGARVGAHEHPATRSASSRTAPRVLGLGDIGCVPSMPVMEGKALLFDPFAGVGARRSS